MSPCARDLNQCLAGKTTNNPKLPKADCLSMPPSRRGFCQFKYEIRDKRLFGKLVNRCGYGLGCSVVRHVSDAVEKKSFAPGTVAANAQAFISGETMVSRSPVHNNGGRTQIRVGRYLGGDEAFEQRKVTSVRKKCLWPEHQPDGRSAHVVLRHRLGCEHGTRDTVGYEKNSTDKRECAGTAGRYRAMTRGCYTTRGRRATDR